MKRHPPPSRCAAAAGSGGFSRSGSVRNTSAVDTGRPGQTSTSGRAGQPSRRSISSPIPRARSAPPREAHRNVGAELEADCAENVRRNARPEEAVEGQQNGGRVGRSAAQPGAGRNVLLHADRRARPQPGMGEKSLRRAPGKIGAVAGRMRGEAAGEGDVQPVGGGDLDAVADLGEDGDAVDEMVEVGAPSGHMQGKVDLRRRVQRQTAFRHGAAVRCRRGSEAACPGGCRRGWRASPCSHRGSSGTHPPTSAARPRSSTANRPASRCRARRPSSASPFR